MGNILCGVITELSMIQKASQYADILEIRWDCLNCDPIRIDTHLPLIFTLRPASQGGFYNGTEEERLQQIEQLAAYHPEFIDLEYTVPLTFIQKLKQNHPSIKIILSYHSFDETPSDLSQLIKSLKEKPADFYKISTMANSTLDALRMLNFSKMTESNVIALCMGELGIITRIINHWSYGCVDEVSSTARGQLSLQALHNVYRFKSLNTETAIFGLIGDPVNKSASEITHNRFFAYKNLNAVYVKMQIKQDELNGFFKEISTLNFKGLSVTMPLKQAVLPYLDEIDEKAKAISAVNTIVIQNQKLRGLNTDCTGAAFAIEEKTALNEKKVLIIGAGGASSAIAYEAILKGAFVTILNRDSEKAVKLAQELGCQGDALENIATYYEEGYDILINCTPDEMPFDPCYIKEGSYVMDIKSFPKWTTLLKEAAAKKCTPIFGYDMFIHQAIGQFEAWQYCCKKERPSFLELFNLSLTS